MELRRPHPQLSTVFSILSLKPPIKQKDIPAKLSAFPQFHNLQFPAYQKSQLRRIKKRLPKASRITDLFSDVTFDFSPDRAVLESIAQFRSDDPAVLRLTGAYALFSYVSFTILFDLSGATAGVDLVFASLVAFRVPDWRALCASALDGVVWVLSVQYDERLLPSISQFYLHRDFFDRRTVQSQFGVLPRFLQTAITGGAPAKSLSGQVCSLIAMLLIEHAECFLDDTVTALYQLVSPFLYQLRDSALMML
jgi:hypothetical protein